MTDEPLPDRSPTNQPLTDQPPMDRPMADQSLAERPLGDQPPTGRPPADQPLLGESLPDPGAAGFAEAFDRFGDARVVLLGEATHGTHEFYAARARITQRLIEEHGFNIVAVEGDWPDIARIDDYVRHGSPRPRAGEPFTRFPTWMWRNEEVQLFADWLRRHNSALPESQRASMRGLDVYSLRESIHAVIAYLEPRDPGAAAEARRRYGCLTPWQDEPQSYGRAVQHGGLAKCEDTMVAQLNALLARRWN